MQKGVGGMPPKKAPPPPSLPPKKGPSLPREENWVDNFGFVPDPYAPNGSKGGAINFKWKF
ncbi:MAG UNVERIFIED_CONTAM: hypothetical protein LVQ98_08415 [Rickettsiaceae bacterium]|jgi:hypothetical protein